LEALSDGTTDGSEHIGTDLVAKASVLGGLDDIDTDSLAETVPGVRDSNNAGAILKKNKSLGRQRLKFGPS
jgi:hypothetical protein